MGRLSLYLIRVEGQRNYDESSKCTVFSIPVDGLGRRDFLVLWREQSRLACYCSWADDIELDGPRTRRKLRMSLLRLQNKWDIQGSLFVSWIVPKDGGGSHCDQNKHLLVCFIADYLILIWGMRIKFNFFQQAISTLKRSPSNIESC
jgi:hypothetical protein